MTTKKKSQFIIRAASSEDIPRCLRLDHSLETQIVWQMKLLDDEERMQVVFQTLRLPRPIRVEYPRTYEELKHDLTAADGILVAESEGVLLGYTQVILNAASPTAMVRHLVVDEPWRRRRIGRALLEQARGWAQQRQAKYLSLETTARSYPAIHFMMGRGLSFCGFHDRYFASQDIAIFFGQNL